MEKGGRGADSNEKNRVPTEIQRSKDKARRYETHALMAATMLETAAAPKHTSDNIVVGSVKWIKKNPDHMIAPIVQIHALADDAAFSVLGSLGPIR
jgi:hypothetical protein